MSHDDDVRVADLVARLGDGDTKDLFRRLLQQGVQELIDAEPHERTESRTNQRNGCHPRLSPPPTGDIELRIPKMRVGRSSRRCWSRAVGSTKPCGR